jgi:hypothetical protein
VDQQLPIGAYTIKLGRARKLGSRLTAKMGEAGRNFLTPETARLVRREVAYREIGAFIDEERLRTNLLSSMPLAFNLFGPLKLDLTLATRVLRQLLPDFAGKITQLGFEHAPGRGDPAYTGDHTAFDVLLRYRTPEDRSGCLAIEVKYWRACRNRCRCSQPLRRADPGERALRDPTDPGCARTRCSSSPGAPAGPTMVGAAFYAEGRFPMIAPRLNYHAWNRRARLPGQHRRSRGQRSFANVTLEAVIAAVAAVASRPSRRRCTGATLPSSGSTP